ncbi:seryl-tRNA synthetase (serin-tRNA ligase) (nucleomorph) [Chroomonas mesostigmatica CCMP1168]|uniref:serine--tRNA ligase n=1 Tax=Chroomonas mesostigmatica CCMP1168 TaxID=1195612 RepID=J7G2N8_9CRYP|nr:seryl-tRNA synthetase (serin-tRNA ligase) [Chroomonas mesostigmatica CCMP1168]|mmetsp:Transcript_25619/g.63124  ORF Transcript_25619/g.63124 Transcript_25619/m.63124 type:complete len:435 (-) Transcript_25619:2036-3340(-)
MEIKLLRLGKKNYSDIARGSQKRRQEDKSIVDQTLILDNEWKKIKHKFDFSKGHLNKISKVIKNHKEVYVSCFIFNLLAFKKKILKIEKLAVFYEKKREKTIIQIGNIIHNCASFGNQGKNSRLDLSRKIIKKKAQNLLGHVELLEKIGAVEYEKGINISGNRGYFLKGVGLLINNALIRYSLDFLIKKNFIALQTPFFMLKKLLMKCSQLEDFKEQLYSLSEEENKFLIATSEQPITCFHLNETLSKNRLPIKYVGFSTCFRKESGSHGKDTSGIFRVHQFEKVEQFVICTPENSLSWSYMEELLENVKDFYSSINIPYKIINISTEALNNSASKKIDLLGFFPKSDTFKELVSCSNCTGFQSERLKIKTNLKRKNEEITFPHMLNSTLCATSRVICCIAENYQTISGIIVPNVLRNYTGLSFVPFKKSSDPE